MPVQQVSYGPGALSYTSDGGQYGGGVTTLQLMLNTTVSIQRGNLVEVIWDTSVQAGGLGATQRLAASTSAGLSFTGVALATVNVTNTTSTATFQAVNKYGGPQMVDVAIAGGPVLVNVSTASVAGAPSFLFPSTSAPGIAVSTGSIGATSVGGFGGPGSAIGVLLSTAIQGINAGTSFTALMPAMLGRT